MCQREIFRINPCPMPPTYVYVRPCECSVTYQYPYYTSPCCLLTERNNTCDTVLSETNAIRRELSYIKSDIGDIKRQQSTPTYYVVKQNNPSDWCSVCRTSLYIDPPKPCSHVPLYFCDGCHRYVEERVYSAGPRVRSKLPNTTYQDSYKRPPPYSGPFDYLARRITLNELQTESPPSSAPAQHPRHWIPPTYKNSYPHRRWNLSVPHSEP